ncbi:MAG: hypothetical protein RL660_3137 [Bacteroidota bacterium]|jgi:hypothetical protein
MYSFDVVIENKERRIKQTRALHFMAAALLLTVGLVGFMNLPKDAILLYLGFPAGIIVLLAVIFFKQWLENIQSVKLLRLLEASCLAVAAVVMFRSNHYLSAGLFALSSLLLMLTLVVEMQLHIGVRVMVDEKGVTRLVGNRTKFIPWKEVENVMLNGKILTVDMKDNYIMQSKTSTVLDAEDTAKFNDYCKVRMLLDA